MTTSFESPESSTIHGADYDDQTSILVVHFKSASGARVSSYQYDGVSVEAWEALRCSESKGRHFAKEIKQKFQAKALVKNGVVQA